eukprot:5680039-Lingulodinium_polyedra.AAC.1
MVPAFACSRTCDGKVFCCAGPPYCAPHGGVGRHSFCNPRGGFPCRRRARAASAVLPICGRDR